MEKSCQKGGRKEGREGKDKKEKTARGDLGKEAGRKDNRSGCGIKPGKRKTGTGIACACFQFKMGDAFYRMLAYMASRMFARVW